MGAEGPGAHVGALMYVFRQCGGVIESLVIAGVVLLVEASVILLVLSARREVREVRAEVGDAHAAIRAELEAVRGELKATDEAARAALLGHISSMLEGFVASSAGSLVSSIGQAARGEREMIEAQGASVLLQLLQGTPWADRAELALELAGRSALGRKVLKQVLVVAGESPEAAVAMLQPWLMRASGGVRAAPAGQAYYG